MPTHEVPLGCRYSLARLAYQSFHMVSRNEFLVSYDSACLISCPLVFVLFFVLSCDRIAMSKIPTIIYDEFLKIDYVICERPQI